MVRDMTFNELLHVGLWHIYFGMMEVQSSSECDLLSPQNQD